MNWIDTAAVYGLGHSEEVVGRAAARNEAHRPSSSPSAPWCWGGDRRIRRKSSRPTRSGGSARPACGGSDWRRSTSIRSTGPTRKRRSRRAGRRWPGSRRRARSGTSASRTSASGRCSRLEGIAPVESLQPPYSLLNRGIEDEILPYCLKNGIGVIIYSPMASGLLTGAMTRERVAGFPADDWRRNAPELPGTDSHPQPGSRRTPQRDRGARTAVQPAKWPSPGRCAIRPLRPRSSAAGAALRWKESWARPSSASARRKSGRSRAS